MKRQKNNNKFFRFLRFIYLKLFRINDSPHKIALGFGLGVFAGIFPGTGPLASLFLAFIFRANRAAALIGSLLTNTWLSFVTFVLAVQAGSMLLKINWQDVQAKKTILPIALGYAIIAFCCGLVAYLAALITAYLFFRKKNA